MAAQEQAVAEASVDTLKRFFAALNAWDFQTLGTLFTDDAVFEMPYAQRRVQKSLKGRATILRFIKAVPDTLDEPRLQDIRIDVLASDPRELVAEFRSDMTVRATGARYANRYIARATIHDGQIARYIEFFDPTVLAEALPSTRTS
jgi:ketosteroid isomerase-like protein